MSTSQKMKARKSKIKEVRANRFVLEDSEGKTKALLDASHDGLVLANIMGKNGSGISVQIGADGNPALSFMNKTGKIVMGMGVSDKLGQGFTICDTEGRMVCVIFVAPDGIPRIKLFDANREALFWAAPEPESTKKPGKKKSTAKKKPAQ